MSDAWTRVGSREIADCRVFRVRADRYRHRGSSGERDYFVLDSHDWVNVIAVTADDHVVLVEQFRHGVRRSTLEIPGGTFEPGEEPLAAGLRELAEETGYGGGRASILGWCDPNPAIQSNRCWFVLVEEAEPVGPARPDPGEDIVVRLRPLADIAGLVADGTISHALVIAAFARFEGYARRRDEGGSSAPIPPPAPPV